MRSEAEGEVSSMGSDRELYGEGEGLTLGSPIVSDIRKKVRAKKRLLDAVSPGKNPSKNPSEMMGFNKAGRRMKKGLTE
jgi:hypothetical protein